MDRNFRSGGNSACKKRQRKGRNRVQKHMDPAKLARVAGPSHTPLRIEAQGGKVMTRAALARERAELKTRLAKINAIASSPRRGGVLFSDYDQLLQEIEEISDASWHSASKPDLEAGSGLICLEEKSGCGKRDEGA